MSHGRGSASVLIIICIAIGVSVEDDLLACGGMTTVNPPALQLTTGSPGMISVGIEVEIFAPSTPTVCVCGIGFQGPPVANLDVTDVTFALKNKITAVSNPIVEFAPLQRDLTQDAVFSNAQPAFNWFGFSGLIQPFSSTALGPNEQFVMQFDVEVPLESFAAFSNNTALFGAGAPGELQHPIAFGTAVDARVPEPASAALFGLAGMAFLLRKTGSTDPV